MEWITLTLDFQCQIWKWTYLIDSISDSHNIRMYIKCGRRTFWHPRSAQIHWCLSSIRQRFIVHWSKQESICCLLWTIFGCDRTSNVNRPDTLTVGKWSYFFIQDTLKRKFIIVEMGRSLFSNKPTTLILPCHGTMRSIKVQQSVVW